MKADNSNSQLLVSRLLDAVDLMEFGIGMMRQNIRRRLPDASEDQIDRELNRWLIDQPEDFLSTIGSKQETS